MELNLAELAVDLLARAKKRGATEADVVVADGDTFDVQVRLSAVDRLTKAREKRLGLWKLGPQSSPFCYRHTRSAQCRASKNLYQP